MDFFSAISSSLISIIFYCMIVAGVLKLFQITTLLGEIKDALLSQRHQNIVPPAAAGHERPAPPPAAAQWTPAASSSPRPPSTAEYPNYSALHSNPSTTALETVPRVIREPQVVAQAYLTPTSDYPAVHPPLVALDEKMSGEEMLRALDQELRAEEARRASGSEEGRRTPAVVDTTIVTPHE